MRCLVQSMQQCSYDKLKSVQLNDYRHYLIEHDIHHKDIQYPVCCLPHDIPWQIIVTAPIGHSVVTNANNFPLIVHYTRSNLCMQHRGLHAVEPPLEYHTSRAITVSTFVTHNYVKHSALNLLKTPVIILLFKIDIAPKVSLSEVYLLCKPNIRGICTHDTCFTMRNNIVGRSHFTQQVWIATLQLR